jgi:hypothetical protein
MDGGFFAYSAESGIAKTMAVAESMTGYLSSAQVGRRLGVSSARVRALRREGRLQAVSTSLGHLHPASAVEALELDRARRRAAGEGMTSIKAPANC